MRRRGRIESRGRRRRDGCEAGPLETFARHGRRVELAYVHPPSSKRRHLIHMSSIACSPTLTSSRSGPAPPMISPRSYCLLGPKAEVQRTLDVVDLIPKRVLPPRPSKRRASGERGERRGCRVRRGRRRRLMLLLLMIDEMAGDIAFSSASSASSHRGRRARRPIVSRMRGGRRRGSVGVVRRMRCPGPGWSQRELPVRGRCELGEDVVRVAVVAVTGFFRVPGSRATHVEKGERGKEMGEVGERLLLLRRELTEAESTRRVRREGATDRS
jgi:hypothetical protein